MTKVVDAFISYAVEDREAAIRLRSDLRSAGISTWLDVDDLLPGQNWKREIAATIDDCRCFISLLSKRSVNKRGYVQKELRAAIEILDQMPEAIPFVLPVRLDDCAPPISRLNEIHRVDLFESWDDSVRKIIRIIRSLKTDNWTFMTLIQLGGGDIESVRKQLSAIPEIDEVITLMGSAFDVMVAFSINEPKEVTRVVIEQIRRIQGITNTSTFWGQRYVKGNPDA